MIRKSRLRKSPVRRRSVRKSKSRKSPLRKRSVRKSRRRKSPVRRRSVRKSQLRNYYAPKRDLEDIPLPPQARKKKQTVTDSVPNSATVSEPNEPVLYQDALYHLKDLNIDLIGKVDFKESIKTYLSSFKLYRCITLDELMKMKTKGFWDTLRNENHQNIVSVGKWIAHQKMAQYSSTGLDFHRLLEHFFCGKAYNKVCMISINLSDVINMKEVRIRLPHRLPTEEIPEINKEGFKIYTRFNTTGIKKSRDIMKKELKYNNSEQRIIRLPRNQKSVIQTELDIYPAFNKSLTDRWSDGQVKPEKFSRAQNNFRAAWAVSEVVLSGIVNLDFIKVVADNSKDRENMREIPAIPVKKYTYPKEPSGTPHTFEEAIAIAEKKRAEAARLRAIQEEQRRSRQPIRSYRTKSTSTTQTTTTTESTT